MKATLLLLPFLTCLAVDTVSAADPNTRGAWTMDGTGTTLLDVGPTGSRPFTLADSAFRSNSLPWGTVLHFPGTPGVATAEASLLNNLPQGSVELWVYQMSRDPVQGAPLLSKGNNLLTDFVMAIGPDGTIGVHMGTPRYFQSVGRVPLQRWTKVAVTWDGTWWKVYINDQLDNQTLAAEGPHDEPNNLVQIGKHNHAAGPLYLHGLVDNLRISTEARNYSPSYEDDFEGTAIDSFLWLTGGARRGFDGFDGGPWVWSATQGAGRAKLSVQGPVSGNTYGADAWMRTLCDYNNGRNHIINFVWGASVNASHIDALALQFTDGTVPLNNDVFWPMSLPSIFLTASGFGPLAQPCANTEGLRNISATNWSVFVDAVNATATLFSGPNLSGTVICQQPLNPATPWHLRFVLFDATSAGYPAGDDSFYLYDFRSEEQPDHCFFTERFSSSPPWNSDDPARITVDAAGMLHAVQTNVFGTYAYTNLSGFDPNRSWSLTFDLRINNNEWSGGVNIGLFDSRLLPPYGAILDMSTADGGNGTALYGNGQVAGGVFNPPWQTGIWYRARLTYDSASWILRMDIRRNDSGSNFMSLSVPVASFPADMTRLGISRKQMAGGTMGVDPFAHTDFNLDNVCLYTAPTLVAHPISQTIADGGPVVLRVEAIGGAPYSYQWQLGGINIAGATNATLALSNVVQANCGAYRVIVRNALGEVISQEAIVSTLGMAPPVPVIQICGGVGRNYRIDYTTDVGPNPAWSPLTTVVLPASPYLHIDTSSLGQPRRFYRAVLLP